jgi:hypothetical protein
MRDLRRLAIVVKGGDPYLRWARALAGPDAGAEVYAAADSEYVFLVDEPEEFDPEELIAEHFAEMFDEMLWAWHREKRKWPCSRTAAMFREWFVVRVVDIVVDLGQDEP